MNSPLIDQLAACEEENLQLKNRIQELEAKVPSPCEAAAVTK
jgi:cell division septum initiation protein DivIVA